MSNDPAPSFGLFKREWMNSELHPLVYAYYYKQWADYSMDYHTHDSIEIMYVITGECRIETDSAPAYSSSSHTLRRSDFIVLDANVPHRLIVDDRGPCRMLNIEFTMQEKATGLPSLRTLANEDPLLAELTEEKSPVLVLRDNDELYPLLKSLVLELDAGERRREMRTGLLFAQLFVTLAHIRKESLKVEENPIHHYVKAAVHYIHHNYDRDIQVKDIAASVNLHPGYLHRIFREGTGETVTAYLNEVRMAKAKMLLGQTDIPVADICDYVGVGSRPYFHAMFKKHTGMTPIAYRNSLQTQKYSIE
ncbi:AraC family transcriptional regulator [Paenibacillus sp. PAMC21692]|uniref:AraC family transcriptional regulator n=1 Tax=Paenibacillus sp. PAMC21692 TaxID=2762320 RepID=UPI0028FCDB24|nr:AraC family transcriptional regulator [Paenibacillus sp. PAMC21692]